MIARLGIFETSKFDNLNFILEPNYTIFKFKTNFVFEIFEEEDGSGEVCEDMDLERSKVQRIADELLVTEKSYVKKLHLLDQVCCSTLKN